jgi:acyl carrier protein
MSEMICEKELGKYIVNRFLHGDSTRLKNDESFFETGIIDSLGVLQLVAFIESKFGVRVDDEDLTPENFETFAKMTGFIENKMMASGKIR